MIIERNTGEQQQGHVQMVSKECWIVNNSIMPNE
jgi:hypothetical protein